MCELATRESSLIMVDEWESEQADFVRSIRLLERYALELNKSTEADPIQIYFLCGSDLVESMFQFKSWKREHVETILDRSETELGLTTQDETKIRLGTSTSMNR